MNSSQSAAKLNGSSTGPRSGRAIGVLGTAARIIAGIVCILLGLLLNSHGIQLRASLWSSRCASSAAGSMTSRSRSPPTEPMVVMNGQVERRDRLGGLLQEYKRAA